MRTSELVDWLQEAIRSDGDREIFIETDTEDANQNWDIVELNECRGWGTNILLLRCVEVDD